VICVKDKVIDTSSTVEMLKLKVLRAVTWHFRRIVGEFLASLSGKVQGM
jgi:hypothetical protein